jgi:transcriptional regulator with XRE-family HTH domain
MQAHQRLTSIREELNLSKKEFHNRLDMSSSAYSRYEKPIDEGGRQFNSKFLIKLYEQFDISPLWILTGNGNKFVSDQDTLSQYLIEQINHAVTFSPEVDKVLKKHILSQIFNDIYVKEKKLSSKLIKALFPNNRQSYFFISILKYIKNQKPTGETYKEIFLEALNAYELKGPFEIEFDRQNLIKVVENLNEDECMHILKNIDISIAMNRKQMDFITSLFEDAKDKFFSKVA